MRDSCGIFAESLRDAEFFAGCGIYTRCGMRDAGCGIFCGISCEIPLRDADSLRDAEYGILVECGIFAGFIRKFCGMRDSCGISAGFLELMRN